jgi:polyhydroxybutyrate depolymerase
MERTYILHVPPGYDGSQPVALVLAFHGLALDANEMIRISGLSPFADTAGFIVAYPNGSGQKKSWSSGHCCGEAALRNVDDVAFVRSLIADISSLANIDPRRIYATGFSNGAIFTYYLACEMADQIAAFAPLSATQVVSDQAACQPSRPVPLLHFHGTADRLNPYNGGTTSAGTEFTSVEQAIAFWVTFDGCPASPVRSTSGSIVHDLYSPCSAGSVVELYTITGGEHAWPGGEAVSAQVGEPNMEISANEIMWEFFQQHPLP